MFCYVGIALVNTSWEQERSQEYFTHVRQVPYTQAHGAVPQQAAMIHSPYHSFHIVRSFVFIVSSYHRIHGFLSYIIVLREQGTA